MPSVPCPNPTTGQPPSGALPLGTNSEPDTTVGAPVSPDVDRYSTLAASMSLPAKVRVTPGMVVADTRLPGPASVRAADATCTGAPPEDGNTSRNLMADG